MADAQGSSPCGRNTVQVQVLSPVPKGKFQMIKNYLINLTAIFITGVSATYVFHCSRDTSILMMWVTAWGMERA